MLKRAHLTSQEKKFRKSACEETGAVCDICRYGYKIWFEMEIYTYIILYAKHYMHMLHINVKEKHTQLLVIKDVMWW